MTGPVTEGADASGAVGIDVVPDLTGFERKLSDGVLPPAVRVGRQMAQAMADPIRDRIVQAVQAGLEAARRDVSAQGRRAGEQYGTSFGSSTRKAIEVELKKLPKAKIDGDNRGALAAVEEVRGELDRLRDKTVTVRVRTEGSAPAETPGETSGAAAAGGGDPFAKAFAAVGNAAVPAAIGIGVGSITPITGAILGVASAFATTGAGIATFAVAAVGHLKEVADAEKLVNDKGVQIGDLPASYQRVIPALQGLQGQWRSFMDTTREPVFDVFAKGLNIAQAGLAQLTPVAVATTHGISQAEDVFAEFGHSAAVANFLSVVQSEAPGAIVMLSHTVTGFGAGLLNVFTAFAPAGHSMLVLVQNLGTEFATWTSHMTASPQFQQFLALAVSDGPKVVLVIVNIAEAAGKLIVGLGPISGLFVTILQAATRLLAVIPPPVWTGITIAILVLWGALKGGAIIQAVSTAFLTLRANIAVVGFVMGGTTGATIALRAALTGLAAATVVGLVLTGIVALLGSLSGKSSDASTAVQGLTSSEQALADAFKESTGAIDDNVRAVAAKALADKGLLVAGQQAGISPKQMVDAYLGSDAAWQQVIDTLKTRRDQFQSSIPQSYDKPGWLPSWADPVDHSKFRTTDQQRQLDQMNANVAAAQSEAGAADKARQSNAALADALTDSGNAAGSAASQFDRYTAAKQASLGTGTDQGKIAQDVTQSYTAYQQALRGVADARYAEGQAARQSAQADEQAARQVKDAIQGEQAARRQVAEAIYSEQQAVRQVNEALYAEQAARRSTQQAVEDLAAARDAAAKKLRDQADTELSAQIALERAQIEAQGQGIYTGPVVDAATLGKQQAQLDLANAQHAYADALEQTQQLQRQGIEGQPEVISARQAVSDALHQEAQAHQAVNDALHQEAQARQAVVDAQQQEVKARQAVTDAYRAQTQTFVDGQHARSQAHQATEDAITAANNARDAYDASTAALDQTSGAAGVAADKMKALRDELAQALAMDTGDAQKQLSDVMRYLTAIKLLAANPTMTWDQAWNLAGQGPQPSVTSTAQAQRIQKEEALRGFSGGGYTGPGGKYEPAGIVHRGEWVTEKELVDAAGGPAGFGHIMAGLKHHLLPGYAGGGLVVPTPGVVPGAQVTSAGLIQEALGKLGFFDTGAPTGSGPTALISAVQNELRSRIDPEPYVFGAVGPYAFDCCIIAGVRVYGPDGAKPIQDVRAGDRVYSYVDGKLETHTVTAAWQSKRQPVFAVRTRNRTVTASANHPFLRLVRVGDERIERWDKADWPGLPERIDGCLVSTCVAPHLAHGLCAKHLRRWEKYGDPRLTRGAREEADWPGIPVRSKVCSLSTCPEPVRFNGMCGTHSERHRKHGDPRVSYVSTRGRYEAQWARLDELKRGDLLVQPRVMPTEAKPYPTLSDGTPVDSDVAWLVGAMVGDGSVLADGLRLCMYGGDRDRAAQIIGNRWRGRMSQGASYGLASSNRGLAHTLAGLGMRRPGPDKRVPEAVWSWDASLQRAFLDGYCDADGHRPVDQSKHGERTYSSASRELVEDVRALHISLGDNTSNVHVTKRNRPITIKGKLVKNARDQYTVAIWPSGSRRYNQAKLRRDEPGLAAWLGGEFTLNPVLAIEAAGEADTWDLNVEGAHNFIADGVVVHNSGLVGDIWAALTGHPRNQRWFVTGSDERNFLTAHGFQPGVGTFTVGFSDEHTAGNLAGLGFEAANHIAGIHVGASAIPVTSFPSVYHLPALGNTFIGSAGQLVHLPGLLGYPGGTYVEPGTSATPRAGGGNAGRPVTTADMALAEVGRLISLGHFDQGGVLRPGWTLAYNGTGGGETVRNPSQEAALARPPVQIDVHPRAEHSEYDIAQMVVREQAWALEPS